MHQKQIQKISQNNQSKKIRIIKNLTQIERRSAQRAVKNKIDEENLKKIENRQKLHQKLDYEWKSKNIMDEKRKEQKMKQSLLEKHTDFCKIKEQYKKYDEIIKQKRQQLMQKRLSSSYQNHNSSFQLEKSKFYTILMKQEQQQRQIIQQNKQNFLQNQRKKMQYAQHIRQKHSNQMILKDHQLNPFMQNNKIKVQILTKEQIKQIGRVNFEICKKKGKKKQNTLAVGEETDKNNLSSITSKHHYYLKQIREHKQDRDKYNGELYYSPKTEATKIMNNTKMDKIDKIQKIKLLADKYDRSSMDLIAKIQGKLQLLEIVN